MTDTNSIYNRLGVSDQVLRFGQEVLEGLTDQFRHIDQVAEFNQAKVIAAMQKNRVNATHFNLSTGYGYDDEGRDNLERVYADCFGAEAALVRPQITCGTHALALALGANLLPGDELLSPVGGPYDTLEEVIGIRPSPCSLKEYGVSYRQVDLLPDGGFDYDGIRAAINEKTRLITIQRSKGYATRPSYSVEEIGKLIAFCKECKPDVLCMVDNCYGEFVETQEPTNVGADMVVGSLIKNLGGGLAPTGGYVCGHVEDPVDAYTFAHVNDGNAVAMPFAKGFGWGGELNLEYCFEKLFGFGHGQGYPKERVEPEQRNKKILDGVRAATFKPLIECLKSIDQDLLKGAIAGEKFSELFFASCKDEELAAYIKSLLA